MAFLNNTDLFYTYIHHELYIGILHNVVALTLGYLTARLCYVLFKNQKTLTVETGIQNSGLLLVFLFFNGLAGMTILVTFWGIWHIISGLILASYWSFKNKEA